MTTTLNTEVASEPAPLDPRADPVMVAMPDGIRLATDVYLPEPTTVPRPTVLIRVPYDKSGRYTFLPQIAARLTAHGFAAVLQDVRGKFRSEGERDPFVNEAGDGYATLDWIVEQPWSNGIVGMMGDSYYGFTQWAAVASGHTALRAIVPRVTGSDFFTMFSPHVVPRIPLYEWIVHTFSVSGMLERPLAAHTEGSRYALPEAAPQIADTLASLVAGNADGSLMTRALAGSSPASRLEIPALHMGGWWDNLQRSQLDDWRRVAGAPAGEHQFLRMRASDHEDFHLREDDEPHFDHEVDDEALRNYLDGMMAEPLAFFDHYLRERPGRWQAPRVRYELANADWCVADRWEPGDTTQVSLTLSRADLALSSSDGGQLSPAAPADSSTAGWTHDPDDPVPYLINSDWGQCANLPEEQELHIRQDVPTFTTARQGAPFDIVGHVTAELHVEASSPTTHVITRLLDVYPSGRARVILEGAAVAHTQSGTQRVAVDLGDTAYRVRVGHRLRLAVTSSCFPLYPVHPGTDADVWHPTSTAKSTHRLHCSTAAPCTLTLPVRGGSPS
ncbi:MULTISPECIES: CocE/NonD family hydrolase [unclassified Mycolicibacterium]|uniref:CocE/NonD family hydrolase n=1 Tax=unclassified Mycolicibacterium TaxID=2636767 RepID=UPI0012DD0853|nr:MULTISPECIES: CocE/NonD family hydrolase [unclassified Mycolicibacterium]MUL80455.1 CocE/NonD family hydrolase [Mycolicibacterium sp. CBMA 329]MUL86222.1 CocE/NonD family hydrolase [Mycolicibacterium sp. CBMA 331]MUM01116.1 CocE/NonD family hydrolase [Mycolicibacterium sp. CBMA 334]MUM25009.1 CocE/NonD family hydrolase [Mycolicibacterium sp. CBMA 295]MUM36518.1 CocE/NonD family hydrolase [Mycolicibacterium sp. CBMA 247]